MGGSAGSPGAAGAGGIGVSVNPLIATCEAEHQSGIACPAPGAVCHLTAAGEAETCLCATVDPVSNQFAWYCIGDAPGNCSEDPPITGTTCSDLDTPLCAYEDAGVQTFYGCFESVWSNVETAGICPSAPPATGSDCNDAAFPIVCRYATDVCACDRFSSNSPTWSCYSH